ncbi:MAG: hypothetical protein GEV08_12745 [Acidimicrobiia bacterium]|nr:hypothetical protein [Acidimicrobiia bacterium]
MKDQRRGAPAQDAGAASRRLAIEVLVRIEEGGAYANLVLPGALDRSHLEGADRRLVTELVYGTTRQRRAVDAAVDPYLLRPVDVPTRAALRVGAYQLLVLGTPPHAAVGATVGAVHGPARKVVNAVLRRVAEAGAPGGLDEATRLSYPDWVVERLVADLGHDDAIAALEAMNQPPRTTERDDGYVQDLASQWVAELVGARPGELVADLAAAPGGKATAMAGTGARVVAVDLHRSRARLVEQNRRRLGLDQVLPVVADGARPPLRPGRFDRVLVDAPCSGLGSLRRRPDARWRIGHDALDRLVPLQRRLLLAGLDLLVPGGVLTYSVCTLTSAETVGIDEWLAIDLAGFEALAPPGEPWRPWGRGALLLPQTAGTDAMFVLQLTRR